MKIIRAEHLGMCFGVRDAITLAIKQSREEPLTILGDLVHNETVLAELRARGIPIPDSLFPVPKVPPNIVRLEPMPVDNAHALVIDNNEEEPTDDDRADQAPAPDAAESRSVR